MALSSSATRAPGSAPPAPRWAGSAPRRCLTYLTYAQARPASAGLAWAVLGLSVGGVLLLLRLIQRQAVAGVSALFYLVPAVSAVMAYALFGETLAPVQVAGMAVAVVGVALASRG